MYAKIFIICLAVLFGVSRLDAQSLRASADKECSIIKSGYRFSFTFYRNLVGKAPSRNLIFSPYSISSASAMVMLGTRGQTEMELKSLLQFGQCNPDSSRIHASQKRTREYIEVPNDFVTLTTANRIFPDMSYQLSDNYTRQADNYYGSAVEKLDFATNSEASRTRINDWVAEKTNRIIKDLLPIGAVDANTQMVLVNAIYFKGTWKKQFDPRKTLELDFHLDDDTKVRTPFMINKGKYKYAQNALFSILELPYNGDTASMIVILPKERNGLSQLERILDGEFLRALTHYGSTTEVNVRLPKFKMESSKDLVESFRDLGVNTLFSGAADFSGMSESRKMFISDIRHKAYIEVNEEGTEAAAATSFAGTRSLSLGTPFFACDHPFLFYIIHKPSKAILFLGRYVTPSQ